MDPASSTAPLFDADARATFTDSLAENLCVSAGAGVGKTTAIVRRIANLALRQRSSPGNPLARLVVVTYGKLAAEELRIRTRDLILQHLHEGSHGRQTLLADLRSAFFGTIHSFCLKLIRDEGRFLGLPENVHLLEDRDAETLWERFCESDELLGLSLPPTLLERVSRHLTFDQLLTLAFQFGPEETELYQDFDASSPPPIADFAVALDDDGGRAKPATAERQNHLRRWKDEFANGCTYLQLPKYDRGSRTFVAAVEEAVKPYAEWLNAAAGFLASTIARAFTHYRLEKGLMTFRDQVYWCGRLVADPVVLDRLRSRGYVVILDEAQDTDAEMFSILTEITRPVGAPAGAWPRDADAPGPEAGRFCFVGDDQQAIYGERADLVVYRRYVDAYRAGNSGHHLEFSVTMRCPRQVIAAVNGVFGGGRLDQSLVRFRPLDPRPGCPDGSAWRLRLAGVPADVTDGGAKARLIRECEEIADLVRARGLTGLGISHWSEIAVICPRVRWLEAAAKVFEDRGIATHLLSQRRIARELPRYSWPAALLHVLVHPWDRFELIGVLREIFAVSDVDVARLHRNVGLVGVGKGLVFWPELPGAARGGVPSPPLRKALELLHELRSRMPGEPGVGEEGASLSKYVDFVLERSALAARLEAVGEPADALRPLRTRALQGECGGLAMRDWVRSLVDALEEPVSPEPGAQDAVQFLTCLKAKGLEWPVVIPLGLGRQIRERSGGYPMLERDDGRPTVHFSAATVDPDRKAVRAGRIEDEYQRMLYVTLTRAKRLLILPDSRELYDGKGPNLLSLARWGELDVSALFHDPPPDGEGMEVVSDASADGRFPLFRDDRRRLKDAAVISKQIPHRVLPSGLVHQKGLPPLAGDTPARDEDDRKLAAEVAGILGTGSEEPLVGIGGIDYGNWWHSVLQHYPWNAADPARRERYIAKEREGLVEGVDWNDRANVELTRLTEGEAHAELLARGAVFLSEMPFAYPRDAGEWIEGIMDLVVVTRDHELWIVDWKTDRRWSSDLDDPAFLRRLADKYGPQLQAYAEVFGRGFGRPVSRLLIYSTVLGRTVSVDK